MSKLWLVCWASLATVGAWAQSTEPEPEPPAEPPKHPITGPVFTPTAPTEVTPGKAPKDGFAERFRRAVLDRITLSGSRRISWHSHGVGGDREAFNLSTTYGLGGQAWSDVGNIAVRGDKVLGLFTFDAVIQDSRFTDPQGQRFRLDYEEGPWSFAAGDIQTALVTGNRYAQFSKSVQGAQVGFRTRDFQVQAITSEAKGQARTISLAGTNSAGPYFLQSNQIIRGSERIEIDGELLTFGSDYTIDYDLGAVTFVNRETLESRLVPPTSTIVASYETLGFAGGRGRIAGAAAGWNVGGGRLGVSLMTQTQGGGGRLSTRLEKFAGFGPPGTPYVLQFLPLAGAPIVIRADGILQTEGLDYTFEPDNRSIFYFTRFMPPSAEIDVLYTPRPTSTAEGDRRVLGLGYSRNLGSLGRINLYTAEGRLSDSGGGDRSGWARGADLNLSRGRADFRVGIQSVPAGFVGIETTGFARAEERADLQLDYRPLAGWRTGLTHQNSSITQIRNEADGSVTFLPSRFTLTGASASGRSGALPWTLNQTRLTSRSLAGETQTDRTEVSTSYTQGRFFVTTGLAREGVLSRTTADSATLERQSLDTRGRYLAGRGWSAGFGASLSRLQTGGDSAAGRDLRLDIGYRPNDRFSSTLEYIDADPGSLTDLSRFQSGFGLGFNGNGFSGGVDGPFLTTTARVRRLALGGAWNPEESLSLFGRLSVSRNQGALSADTETTALSGGLDWGGWSWLRLNGTLAYSRSRSLSSPSLTETTALGFFASGTPAGRFSFTTGASILLSGGNTGFGQNSWQFDLGCLYRPLDRHSFGLNAGLGRSRGYLPQESQDIQAFYRYEVIRGLEVGLSHRWRDIANLDPTVTGGAFRSRGFDLEFNFTFGR